jgi:hypothetical protein
MWIAISIPIWLLAIGSLASRSIRAIAIYLAASSAFAAAAYNIARL